MILCAQQEASDGKDCSLARGGHWLPLILSDLICNLLSLNSHYGCMVTSVGPQNASSRMGGGPLVSCVRSVVCI